MKNKKIELLAPAGDLEKLKVAVLFGADAVYFGGQALSLRAKSKNFSNDDIAEGIKFAHEHGAKAYAAVNVFAHNNDFDELDEYLRFLYDIGTDAIIVSDPGVFMRARAIVSDLEIHISTQSNNTNYNTALFWHKLGAKRIVLARELSLAEIKVIHNYTKDLGDFSLETFVHGAMCISYSGRCLLSNYMTGRDSNHGECAHPCRWNYNLVEEKRPGEYFPVYEDERGTYIFNSKDLCMINNIGDMFDSGIDSFKIEGRMKTSYYVATVVKAYRQAIDDYYAGVIRDDGYYLSQIEKASYRDYTTGFYYNKPTGAEQVYGNNTYIRNYDFIGMVMSYDDKTKIAVVEQRNKFITGDEIEVLTQKGDDFTQLVSGIKTIKDEIVPEAPHAQQILKLQMDKPVSQYDLLRKKSNTGGIYG